jgi:hypothetical protein
MMQLTRILVTSTTLAGGCGAKIRVGFGNDWRVELIDMEPGTQKRFPKDRQASTSNHSHVPAANNSYIVL